MTIIKTPQKLWNERRWINYVLAPLSYFYLYMGQKWGRKDPLVKVSVPVICVGNVVMGGAGKTPVVMALVKMLKSLGHNPHILSRGYGAYIRDVVLVDPLVHTYLTVGDEPLLLARIAPTWAGPNRVVSARAAITAGATVLVMDDGLQNNQLVKDLNFLVIDSVQKLGNEMVFPAGPLRETMATCLEKVQALIIVQNSQVWQPDSPMLKSLRSFSARIEPVADTVAANTIVGKDIIAFCGLGCPEKFRHTLINQGFHIVQFIIYADHHPYTIPDMIYLQKLSQEHSVTLMTTTKDWLRVPNRYRASVEVLPVEVIFDDETGLRQFVQTHVNNANWALSDG